MMLLCIELKIFVVNIMSDIYNNAHFSNYSTMRRVQNKEWKVLRNWPNSLTRIWPFTYHRHRKQFLVGGTKPGQEAMFVVDL